jgi:hypothetical protein
VQLTRRVFDRGSDRDELGELAAPFVTADIEANADDLTVTDSGG